MDKNFPHKKALGVAVLLWALLACSAEPESPARGSCSLKCSGPKVGAAEFQVKLLSDASISSQCLFTSDQGASAPLNGPVQVRYLVTGKQDAFLGGSGSSGSSGTGGATASAFSGDVPRASLGFEPFTMGQSAVDNTTEEFKRDGKVQPFKFAGVVTPSSEWCTDSCGVATIEVWPLCIRGKSNTMKVGLFMEGVSGIPSITVTTDGT